MKKIETQEAPAAVGPYSQGVQTHEYIFVSGQIPLMPDGTLSAGDITSQTEQVCRNLAAVLTAAGSSLSRVVKCEVYLTDMHDFAAMNAVYAQHFTGPVLPARVTVEVARLPKDARVEISCTALTR